MSVRQWQKVQKLPRQGVVTTTAIFDFAAKSFLQVEDVDNWSVVYITMYPQDIYSARNLLESEGITTFLKDELTAQVQNFYSTAIGGVKLLVHNSDLGRSRELLVQGGYIVVEDFAEPPRIETVAVSDRKHCPYCGSGQISKTREANPAAVLLTYVLGLALPMFKRTYQCWDCGKSWKFGRVKSH